MITAITFNPALDRTINVDHIKYGEVNRVGHFREDLGGKGINMGRIIGGFGIETKHITVVGEENEGTVLDLFKKDNMTVDYIKVDGYTRTNMVIVEMDKNITTNLNEAGASVSEEEIEKLFKLIDQGALDSEYLVMGGSLAKGMPVNMYGQVAKKYKGHCKVVIDADDDFLLEGLKGSPFLIKPNIHELENALDRELKSNEEVIEAAREIIKTYGVTYVLVSMGKDGSLLVTADEAIKADAIETTIVSTVGAGDSILAGFVFALEKNMSLKQCLAFGSACSTLTISVAGYPKLELSKVMEVSRRAKVYNI